MANTANYNWPLPSPSGIQTNEVAKIATSFTAIDAKIKAFETSFSNHKHNFAELEEKPTTLGGYGITDGMTAEAAAQAIKTAVDDLINGSGAALDTLKELADALGNDPEFATTVGNALGVRVRVDAAQAFTLAEKAQGRSNIDALGMVDKGKADGVASLDSTGKVPPSQLPALTTTATVGAAMAGANGKTTPADGDFFGGVEAGGSTMFKTTWGNIKTAITAIVNTIVSGNMAGRAYPRRSDGVAMNFSWSGQGGQPSWLFGANEPGTDVRVYNPANFSVNYASSANYANSAGNANTVGGWSQGTIADQDNWRVTDTRFAGWVEHQMQKNEAWHAPSGYVFTYASRNSGDQYNFGARQPQIYIPNAGWRALGGW
ncbi:MULTISPECIES: hypothetical protein [Brucella]|uniref:hypothetical protein n=1 Tax=Brucella TaxID=234 RepID=UPI002165F44E|nr:MULTISPECIES: hypothetical protein [Brucella]UVV66767.1 hypothetical protein NW321_09785 [Brucella anthropi]UZD69141.1 hypothetical protein LJ361_18795 [Brucella sp. JSBI001]